MAQSPIVKLLDLKYDLDERLADIHRGLDRVDAAISICHDILAHTAPAKLAMPQTASVIEDMAQAILNWLAPIPAAPITEVGE